MRRLRMKCSCRDNEKISNSILKYCNTDILKISNIKYCNTAICNTNTLRECCNVVPIVLGEPLGGRLRHGHVVWLFVLVVGCGCGQKSTI